MRPRRSRRKEISTSRERERERERDNPNNSHRPTIPNSPEQNNDKINTLKAEKQQLQTKNQALEQKLANQSLNEQERKFKEKELAANRKLLADKEQELAKLRGNQPTNHQQTKNNDNSLKWAIGLGIVAVVISLLCFILLLRKRKN